MEDLTFGEQVKIILGRKGMTIKELAEIIEERTGKKMSRQNLTQRLGRDNFQEQDMRMMANILGCPFQLSILSKEASAPAGGNAATGASAAEDLRWNNMGQRHKQAQNEKGQAANSAMDIEENDTKAPVGAEGSDNPGDAEEVDMTIGELYKIHEELSELEENAEAGKSAEAIKGESEKAADKGKEKIEKFLTSGIFLKKKGDPASQEKEQDDANTEGPDSQELAWVIEEAKQTAEAVPEADDFEPVIKHDDVEEDLEIGEVNPYTGREFQSNSVRMHPSRIGYVQVYDRKTHKWTDMTEWAFLGYQERKKALLGKEYEPPIYLD